MNFAKWKREIALLAVGSVIGFAVGRLSKMPDFADRYSVHVLDKSEFRAVKLDKKTGDTWLFHYEGYWTNGPVKP